MKAYLVLDLSVNDFGGFRKYIAEIPAFIAKHSGKYIVQGVQPTTIEGDWKPERMVIIEFPEREKAEAFLSDPEIQDLFKVRHDTTTSKLVLADGARNQPAFPDVRRDRTKRLNKIHENDGSVRDHDRQRSDRPPRSRR